MYKLVINELILKNGCQQFLQQFHDTSVDFFFLVIVCNESNQNKRAFFEKGSTTEEYMVYLSKNNTRVLHKKAFEFHATDEPLELSFILIKSSIDKSINLVKIDKIIADKKVKQYVELFNYRMSKQLLKGENTIYFKNTILELNFSLKIV